MRWATGVVLAVLMTTAHAMDGRITFVGAIVTGTCSEVATGANQCFANPARPQDAMPVTTQSETLTRSGSASDPELLAYALNRQPGVTTQLLTVTYK
jgi:hypothetical protein